jgi:ATP-binding cassette, subfamily B, bacterial PglK
MNFLKLKKDLVSFYNILLNEDKKSIKKQILYETIAISFEPLIVLIFGFFAVFVSTDTLQIIETNIYLKEIFNYFKFTDENTFFIVLITAIILIFIILTFLNFLINTARIDLMFNLKVNLSNKLFYNSINQDWLFHVKNPKSVLTKKIKNDTTRAVDGVIATLISLFTNFVKLLVILGTLMIIKVEVASILIVSVMFFFLFLNFLLKKKLRNIGESISKLDGTILKHLLNSLSGIKNIILKNQQTFFTKKYKEFNLNFQKDVKNQQILYLLPPYLSKTIFFIILSIVIIIFKVKLESDIVKYSFIFTVFIYGFLKILNSASICYTNYGKIISNIPSFIIMKKDLEHKFEIKELPETTNDMFKNFLKLELRNIDFSYEESLVEIKKVNINLNKGDLIGITGPTGSGKSTLIDIILGLIKQSSGDILVNDQLINIINMKSWQKIITYVPQQSFFIEDTLTSNIAFGFDEGKIDFQKIKKCVKDSKLEELIEKQSNKLETIISDSGLNVSGGEKQRIAIARALYFDFEIIVLDEATNAMDHQIQSDILTNLKNLGKTIILISHTKEVLSLCDKVFFLQNGKIIKNNLSDYF